MAPSISRHGMRARKDRPYDIARAVGLSLFSSQDRLAWCSNDQRKFCNACCQNHRDAPSEIAPHSDKDADELYAQASNSELRKFLPFPKPYLRAHAVVDNRASGWRKSGSRGGPSQVGGSAPIDQGKQHYGQRVEPQTFCPRLMPPLTCVSLPLKMFDRYPMEPTNPEPFSPK